MAGQHRADDDIAFYAADLGPTRRLSVSTTPAQLPDEDGPLLPGRYVLFVDDMDASFTKAWVRLGAFIKGAVLPVQADVPWFPLSATGLVFIEFHVREKVNDRVAAVTGAGTANLYISLISRDV